MALDVKSSAGGQSATQNPQTAGQPALAGTLTGSIQPGTSQDLLASSGTIPLSNQPLTTVNLSPAASQAQAPVRQPAPVSHHFNALLILITVLLLLIAAGSAVAITRSAKNTTY